MDSRPHVKTELLWAPHAEDALYPEEGQVVMLLHISDFQVLQDYSAVAVCLQHVCIVVVSGAQQV